jgi:hypothetical protein
VAGKIEPNDHPQNQQTNIEEHALPPNFLSFFCLYITVTFEEELSISDRNVPTVIIPLPLPRSVLT